MITRYATVDDLDELAVLFDGYRRFYGQETDTQGAKDFLRARMANDESVILVACAAQTLVGLAQLFPSFSSVRMRPILILNDLYVAPDARGLGAGRSLLDAAARHGREVGAARLTLTTGVDNLTAQSVYRAAGWELDDYFLTFNLGLA